MLRNAINLTRVREITQGRMALQGGVSSKTVLEGNREDIEDEVKTRIAQLGREGGYFCCTDHTMPYSEANLSALANDEERYGRYSLG